MNKDLICPLCQDAIIDHPFSKINDDEEVLVCFGINKSVDENKEKILDWIDKICIK